MTDLEREDYYFENGLRVFTEKYHLKRGYCCESHCRHCPYGLAPKSLEEKDAKGKRNEQE